MKIRLGYACISETLNSNYKTYTYSNFIKDKNKKKKDKETNSRISLSISWIKIYI